MDKEKRSKRKREEKRIEMKEEGIDKRNFISAKVY